MARGPVGMMHAAKHALDDRSVLGVHEVQQVEELGDIGVGIGLIGEHLRRDRDVPPDSHPADSQRAQLQIPQPVGLQLHDMRRKGCAEHDRVPPLALERCVGGMGHARSGVGVVADEVVGAVVASVVHAW